MSDCSDALAGVAGEGDSGRDLLATDSDCSDDDVPIASTTVLDTTNVSYSYDLSLHPGYESDSLKRVAAVIRCDGEKVGSASGSLILGIIVGAIFSL